MNLFDMIGPVMIRPSSSHTAGAARIGRVARQLLGEKPVRAPRPPGNRGGRLRGLPLGLQGGNGKRITAR